MIQRSEGELNITSADRMVFNLPLTYEEMILLVPEEIRNPEDKRHRAVFGLIQCMARQLEDARRVSTIQPSQYLRGYERGQSDVQTQFRIRGIQQEMAAVKFRLEINDFRGPAEEEILKNRMLELYELAKRLDPSGVGRFEHRIDKRMKKVRLRENGNYGGNQTGRNERVRVAFTQHGRAGIENLIAYIGASDFYTAPASTKFHGSFMGGLLHHSLEVYRNLDKKTSGSEYNVWRELLDADKVGNDSIIIVSLLHDICKTHFYTTELKNQKNYDQAVVAAADRRQVKHDNNGDFIWETVPSYAVDDKIPYGHGEKSVMMIENFITLKPLERYAIRWHMGFSEPKELYNTLTAAIERYPLILALHEADMEASYVTEERNE